MTPWPASLESLEDAGSDPRYAPRYAWTPQESFATGLRKTVQWYLANRAWCELIQSRGYKRERLGLVRK